MWCNGCICKLIKLVIIFFNSLVVVIFRKYILFFEKGDLVWFFDFNFIVKVWCFFVFSDMNICYFIIGKNCC